MKKSKRLKLDIGRFPFATMMKIETRRSFSPLKDLKTDFRRCSNQHLIIKKRTLSIMEDEHLSTILKTESDEFIKSSVENLVQIPSEFRKILPEGECGFASVMMILSKNAYLNFSNTIFDINNVMKYAGEPLDLKSNPPGIGDDNLDPRVEISSSIRG
ncbi:hypothetical protein Tco_0942083 [Tanacetum coccineum]